MYVGVGYVSRKTTNQHPCLPEQRNHRDPDHPTWFFYDLDFIGGFALTKRAMCTSLAVENGKVNRKFSNRPDCDGVCGFRAVPETVTLGSLFLKNMRKRTSCAVRSHVIKLPLP